MTGGDKLYPLLFSIFRILDFMEEAGKMWSCWNIIKYFSPSRDTSLAKYLNILKQMTVLVLLNILKTTLDEEINKMYNSKKYTPLNTQFQWCPKPHDLSYNYFMLFHMIESSEHPRFPFQMVGKQMLFCCEKKPVLHLNNMTLCYTDWESFNSKAVSLFINSAYRKKRQLGHYLNNELLRDTLFKVFHLWKRILWLQ